MSKNVGQSKIRVDAYEKATGRAKYTDDLCDKSALIAKIYHSTFAHGFVKSVDTTEAEKISGVIKIVTCFDVPDIQFPTPGHPWSTDPHHQDVADRKLLNQHAWEAIIELTGPEGVRRVPIHDFYIKAGKVDIREGEIQTAILIPKTSYENTYGHYIKYAMRNAMDIATLGTSVNVRLSPDKKAVERVRIAFGVAGPVPMRAPHAEEAANGQPLTEDLPEKLSKAVLEDINPRDSWRASRAFRQHIAVESASRAFLESVKLCGGVL